MCPLRTHEGPGEAWEEGSASWAGDGVRQGSSRGMAAISRGWAALLRFVGLVTGVQSGAIDFNE
jgi:hypothetical protein